MLQFMGHKESDRISDETSEQNILINIMSHSYVGKYCLINKFSPVFLLTPLQTHTHTHTHTNAHTENIHVYTINKQRRCSFPTK